MKLKSLLALLLALALCLAPVSALASGEDADPAEEPAETAPDDGEVDMAALPGLGDQLPDFSFTTFDGKEYTLSQVLKEKQMVLLNLWATWCGPCESEFPFLEEAYEQYKDSVEIFALSVEPEDTDEVLAEYVEGHGMTFPVGRDEEGLGDVFVTEGIPTSVVIDRNGVICAIEVGSQPSAAAFTMLFDTFTGDDYTEPLVLEDGFPDPPHTAPEGVEPTDEAALAEALLGEGNAEITVTNPEDDTNWPMAVAEEQEHTCLVNTNAGVDYSHSAVELQFTAEAGSAFAMEYRVSSESGYDTLTVSVNGEAVKSLSGEKDWRTYAYVLEEAGDYTVRLEYFKDDMESGGSDMVWLSNARVVTGDAVDEVLAMLPTYPSAEESFITVVDESAQEIVFDDPTGFLTANFGDAHYFIVPEETVTVSANLSAASDPEDTYFYSVYDSDAVLFADCVNGAGDGYIYTSNGIDSMETTGYSYTYVAIDGENDYMEVMVFVDEPNVNAFVEEALSYIEDEDATLTWTYADGTAPSTDEVAKAAGAAPEGYTNYTLVFSDQNGDPVEGVIANVCDDESCEPMTSDADGLIQFTKPTFAYHIQVIKVPEGYEYDTSEERYIEGDSAEEMLFYVLTKS